MERLVRAWISGILDRGKRHALRPPPRSPWSLTPAATEGKRPAHAATFRALPLERQACSSSMLGIDQTKGRESGFIYRGFGQCQGSG